MRKKGGQSVVITMLAPLKTVEVKTAPHPSLAPKPPPPTHALNLSRIHSSPQHTVCTLRQISRPASTCFRAKTGVQLKLSSHNQHQNHPSQHPPPTHPPTSPPLSLTPPPPLLPRPPTSTTSHSELTDPFGIEEARSSFIPSQLWALQV